MYFAFHGIICAKTKNKCVDVRLSPRCLHADRLTATDNLWHRGDVTWHTGFFVYAVDIITFSIDSGCCGVLSARRAHKHLILRYIKNRTRTLIRRSLCCGRARRTTHAHAIFTAAAYSRQSPLMSSRPLRSIINRNQVWCNIHWVLHLSRFAYRTRYGEGRDATRYQLSNTINKIPFLIWNISATFLSSGRLSYMLTWCINTKLLISETAVN